MIFAVAMVIGLVVDAALGWPSWLFQRVGHPVTWIGRLISFLDTHMNRYRTDDAWNVLRGTLAALSVISIVAVVSYVVTICLPGGWMGLVLTGVLAWPFIALRSLYEHVSRVASPLGSGDLNKARESVSMIVGRDPTQLDEAGIARASLETLAENASDGVVAPVFWGLLFGLPGIAVYKTINTLDSMIGHRTEKYEQFGKFAARLDDVVNLIPARLTGLLFVAVSGRIKMSATTMLRDANHHRSPNAGWPEAAMAGSLGIRMSGPRVYGDRKVEEPWLNGTARDPLAADISRGLIVYRRAMILGILLLMMLAAVF